ncbi:hypothetical protein [Spirosoma aerolatum]|uniref:hypothetical protein n=1 Tax=Spirosoma aerolatum TaxID=1211326 RepID=UPI0009ADC677|nr:hypothetical protein [Spirosoma aerolatum]
MGIVPKVILFVALVPLSCATELPSVPIPNLYSTNYWGVVTGARQGNELSNARIAAASRVPCTAYAFDITITEFADNGEKLATLTLFNIPKKPGSLTKFKVDYRTLYCGTDSIGCTFTTLSNKLPWGTYKPVIGSGTQLMIQSFDEVSGEIKGTANIRMIPDQVQDAAAPNPLSFKNIKFLTKLKYSNGTYVK